ncbi:MAG: ArsR/SmtB family transcription factor [Thermoplasmata archaeon]
MGKIANKNNRYICVVKKISPVDINNYEEIEKLIKVLGNRTRLAVLYVLIKHKEICACDLEKPLKLPQSTVTLSLLALYRAGFLNKRKDWRFTYYSIKERYRNIIEEILQLSNK